MAYIRGSRACIWLISGLRKWFLEPRQARDIRNQLSEQLAKVSEVREALTKKERRREREKGQVFIRFSCDFDQFSLENVVFRGPEEALLEALCRGPAVLKPPFECV